MELTRRLAAGAYAAGLIERVDTESHGKSESMKRLLDKSLLDAVDEGLRVLGESVKSAIYYHVEKNYNVRRGEVPERLAEFHQALVGVLGAGALVVEADRNEALQDFRLGI